MANQHPTGWSSKTWQLPDLIQELNRIPPNSCSYLQWAQTFIIPLSTLTSKEHEPGCSLCGVNYGEGDTNMCLSTVELPQELPCGHHFGHICIAKWFSTSAACPNCRHEVAIPFSSELKRLDQSTQCLRKWCFWLLWIIERHGISRGAALDREFQFRVRACMKKPSAQNNNATGVTGILGPTKNIREALRQNASSTYNEADHSAQDFGSPFLKYARDDRIHAWMADFGGKSGEDAWKQLHSDRMVEWIKRPCSQLNAWMADFGDKSDNEAVGATA